MLVMIMKKFNAISSLLVLLTCTFLASCTEEHVTGNDDLTPYFSIMDPFTDIYGFQSGDPQYLGPSAGTPFGWICAAGSKFCSFMDVESGELDEDDPTVTFTETTTGEATIKVTFNQYVGWTNMDIAYQSPLPTAISEGLGYTDVHCLPGLYPVTTDAAHPDGYAVIDIVVVEQ